MKDLLKAMANFQYEVPIIHKATAGYSYTYTDLPEIIRTITPLLKKHNLGYTQLLDGINLKTIIYHTETGQMLESSVEIPQNETLKGMNKFQILGSAITYFRRYALSSALGLVTDKDIDGCGVPESQEEKLLKINKELKEVEEKINTFTDLNLFQAYCKSLRKELQTNFKELIKEKYNSLNK